jgi:hypothetical protein
MNYESIYEANKFCENVNNGTPSSKVPISM